MTVFIKPDSQLQYGPDELDLIPDNLFNEYGEFLSDNTDAQEEWVDVTAPSFWNVNSQSSSEDDGLLWTGVDWIIRSETGTYLYVRGDWTQVGWIYEIRVTFNCSNLVTVYINSDENLIDAGRIRSEIPFQIQAGSYMMWRPITKLNFVESPPVYTLHITKIEIRPVPQA